MPTRTEGFEAICAQQQPEIEAILKQLQTKVQLPQWLRRQPRYNTEVMEGLALRYNNWREETDILLKEFFDEADIVNAPLSEGLEPIIFGKNLRTAEGFASIYTAEILGRAIKEAIIQESPESRHGSESFKHQLEQLLQRLDVLKQFTDQKWHEAGDLLSNFINRNSASTKNSKGGRG